MRLVGLAYSVVAEAIPRWHAPAQHIVTSTRLLATRATPRCVLVMGSAAKTPPVQELGKAELLARVAAGVVLECCLDVEKCVGRNQHLWLQNACVHLVLWGSVVKPRD
jgi:hypothetical protein